MLGSEAQGNRRSVLKIHRRQKVRKREDKKAGNLWGARGTALGWRDRQHKGGSGSIPNIGKKENEGSQG